MIVHIQLNNVATLTVGITDQMQQDMIRCRKTFETTGNGPEWCGKCSWNDIEFNGIGLCEDHRVTDAVMAAGDKKDICIGCFGAANGDCDNCDRKQ